MAEMAAPPRSLDQPDVPASGGADAGAGSGGGPTALPPMPKRVADTSLADLAPDEAIAKLLARAARLVEQLQTDVEELAADQREEQERIEGEWRELEAALQSAIERLDGMTAEAREIALKKARLDDLEAALSTPVRLDASTSFLDVAAELERELKLAHGITGAIRLPAIGKLIARARLAIEELRNASERTRQRLLSETTETMHAEGTEARASFDIGLSVLQRDLELLGDSLPLTARTWDHPSWDDWAPPASPGPWIRIGDHVDPELAEVEVPALFSFDGATGLLFEPGDHRADVVAGVQSMLVRIIAGHPPGAVRFTLIDPKGLGDSVAPLLPLAEYDPDLIDGGVKTLEDEIEAAMAGLVRHIEMVTQRYLQGRFESLDDYRESVGELVEPTRFLVVVDHPTGLSEQAATLMHRVLDTGARAGVHAIVVKSPKPGWQPPAARTLPGLRTFKARADGIHTDTPWGSWRVSLDALPSERSGGSIVDRVVREVGQAARELVTGPLRQSGLYAVVRERQHRHGDDLDPAVTALDPDHPSTWWQGDASDGAVVALGVSGEREPVLASFDANDAGLLIAGVTARDVASAIDSVVTGIAMTYAPTEVQLIATAFGTRSERPTAGIAEPFAGYGEAGLPHARFVATDAERELVVSLLDTLDSELDRRLARFRGEGCERSGLGAYRKASGRRLSRIVLVVAGIGELLRDGDRTSQRAERLLSRLALEGPPLGLHLVVGEQLARENADVIVRMGDLFHSKLLIVDDVESLAPLLPEGVLADELGDQPSTAVMVRAESCTALRLVRIGRQERASCLRELRHLADERGVVNRPQVFRGDGIAQLEHAPLALLRAGQSSQGRRLKPRLWIGEPVGLGPPVELLLRREPAGNLLVVGDPALGEGVLLAAATSGALSQGEFLDLRALDFSPIEGGFGELLASLEPHVAVRVARRDSTLRTLDEVCQLIAGRHSASDFRSRPVLVTIAGASADAWSDPAAGERLRNVLQDGPPVGVHVLLAVDSALAAIHLVGDRALGEFAYRIVGPMDASSSSTVVESQAASTLRSNQALLYDESRGRLLRFRPYGSPRPGWRVPAPPRDVVSSA